MISIDDWKEYTRQIDKRNALRAVRDFKLDQKRRKEWKEMNERLCKEHYARQEKIKEYYKEQGVSMGFYFPSSFSFFTPMMYFGGVYLYADDRTLECCLDWVVKGRPKIKL